MSDARRMNDAPKELIAALVEFKKEAPTIPKSKTATVRTKTGPSYSYQFADIADCVRLCDPILAKHGLAVTQMIGNQAVTLDDQQTTVTTLTTTLWHVDGGSICNTLIMCGVKVSDQEMGTAATYKRRYAYCAILGVVADEDVDMGEAGRKAPFDGAENPPGPPGRREVVREPFDPEKARGADPVPDTPRERVARLLKAWKVPKNSGPQAVAAVESNLLIDPPSPDPDTGEVAERDDVTLLAIGDSIEKHISVGIYWPAYKANGGVA